MKQVVQTPHEFGPLRESTEWTNRVVRDANDQEGVLKTWFDSGAVARKMPRATDTLPDTAGRRAGAASPGPVVPSAAQPHREPWRLPGWKFIASRTIGTRLDWATGTALAIIAVMLVAAYTVETRHADAARTGELRVAIEGATTIAAAYEREERSGHLTHAVAQSAALSVIKAIRYRGDDHILITDLHPRMVMNPITPERDGNDLTNVTTSDGKQLFVALVNVVLTSGSGVVDYSWQRPGTSVPVRRRAYAQGFLPWGWVLSGADDIDDLASGRWRMAETLFGVGTIACAVIGLVVGCVARTIARRIRGLATATELLSQGNLSGHIPETDRLDELGILAHALELLKKNAVDRARIIRVGMEERAAKERRQAAMDSLTRDFSEAFAGVLGRLSRTAREISGTARTIADGTGHARDRVARAAADWTEAAGDMTVMALGLADLSAVLGDVDRQTAETTRHLAPIAENAAAAGQKLSALAARAGVLAKNARGAAGSFAGETRALTDTVAAASSDLGEVVEALRDEVNQFVMTLVQGETLRRRYERVSGNGKPATLIVPNGPRVPAVMLDLSRGGAALLSTLQGEVGDAVLVAFSDTRDPVSARIVRYDAGVVAVAFRQDQLTLAAVDAVLDGLAPEVPAA